MTDTVIPDPAFVVLVGAAGSGKSTWAAEHYLTQEIVSSDRLRLVVGSGEHDQEASADAFALLDQIIAARARRGLTTVVDTLGLDPVRRLAYLGLARRSGLPAIAVLFDTPAALCRQRNRRRDPPVPAAVLDAQLARMRDAADQLAAEGWDAVLRLAGGQGPGDGGSQPGRGSDASGRSATTTRLERAHSPGSTQAAAQQRSQPATLEFILQISRFGWADDPAARTRRTPAPTAAQAPADQPARWLRSMAAAAAEAGFSGLALMDHLIQIPQVGRAFEPILEPWVTLGFLAGLDTTLRLGTLVTPVTFRAPGILAKTAATLDVLSGGRAFCGIGAGWWEREHAAFGLAFPDPPGRIGQLETAIETMRALWQPGTKPYDGQRVRLPETTCYPRPVSPIQVIVGGSGDHTLGVAARLGDGCNLPAQSDVLDRKLPVLRRHCERAGRDPAEVAVTVLDIPVIGRDRADVARLVGALAGPGRGGRGSAAAVARRHHAGVAADHIGRYRLLADRGVAAVFVSLPALTGPDDLSVLAPVVRAFG